MSFVAKQVAFIKYWILFYNRLVFFLVVYRLHIVLIMASYKVLKENREDFGKISI